MSRLVTLLGVVYAVALAVSPDLVAINPTVARYAMLVGLAAAAAGKALTAQDVREARGLLGGFPRRGMYAARSKTLKTFALLALIGLLASSAACKAESVRSVSAGVAVGAGILRDEVAAGLSAGDYTADEAALLNPIIDETKRAASDVRDHAAGWDAMTKPERHALALEAVEKIGNAVGRLSASGVGVKSARGRARLEQYLRKARLAVGALRVIEAALPRK